MKQLLLPLFLLLLASDSIAQSEAQETHLREPGSSAIFLRSAFVHGYRHGYEEGYHLGNMDINMGRHARTKLSEFHGVSLQYSPEFGPRKSFEAGFRGGLKAGYSDGFAGRKFRAVDTLRSISTALDQKPSPFDPNNTYFDQGVSAGYNSGRSQQGKDVSAERPDLDVEGCAHSHPLRREVAVAQGSFCDGYHRGYLLGQADARVLTPDSALSARK